MTLKAGNPYLMPEKVHSLEAGYQWKNGGTIILGSLYYRYVTDKLTTVTRYVDNNVLLTTTENLDNSMAAGAEVIVDAEVGKWLTFNFSGNLFYNRIDASRLGYGSGWSSALTPGCCILACSGISVRPAVVSDVRERPSGFLQNSYRILLYLCAVTITLHRIWK
ncbi:MAG TPA: TonB-dependent receptor [Candidatus Coprenecus stercorigallinarum]|nr:TonB-dependent receptor [Candidatus Coprenecus stercorigallinarum]